MVFAVTDSGDGLYEVADKPEFSENEPTAGKTCARHFSWVSKITVEPVMFLYMFAFMLTSVTEQAFYVDKACRVDLHYNDTVCSNLTDYEELNKNVQVIVSNFYMYSNIASHAIPIVLALFIGAWSDRRGRKLPLLIGLAGKIYFSTMMVVNATQETWSLNVILWSATFPMALTGADLAIFASVFSYMADVTTVANRSIRITILDVVYLASMPTGVALGKVLFSTATDENFAAMFGINALLLVLAFVYALVRLEWYTKPTQRSMRADGANYCTDFFDSEHVKGTLRALVRKRPGNRRMYLIILICAMALYTFQRDEKQMSYLYTQLKFQWTADDFSNYRTFQSTFYVIGTLCGLPLMGKLCGLKDTVIVMIGATAHASARVVFALAEEPWLFYLGGAIVGIGPVVAPVIRSMTSKIVPLYERGKVFALLACADNAMPLFSGIIYSQVYNATINTAPNSIYWVTFASQVGVFLLITVIHVSLGDKPLALPEEDSNEGCPTDTESIARLSNSTLADHEEKAMKD